MSVSVRTVCHVSPSWTGARGPSSARIRGCFVLAVGVTNSNGNGLSFRVGNHGVTRHWFAGEPQFSALQGGKLG
jgi:hypothetical protein